jgi:hypothetical protein
MKININTTKWEKVKWNGWDALRCAAGRAEIIVGVSAGPRVLSLRWNDGPNLLYWDREGFGVGMWRLFGGHRLSIAPESPASYVPDNHPCLVWIDDMNLKIETASLGGLKRGWTVIPHVSADGFEIEHVITNDGDKPWCGALWALTCVEPEGKIISPSAVVDGIQSIDVPSDEGASAQWTYSDGYVLTTPLGLRGKAGWYSDEGWLALLRPDVTFIIHSPDAALKTPEKRSICNVEVFSCNNYLEMETLGDEVMLPPGESAIHCQAWRLQPGGLQPQHWEALSSLVGRSGSVSYAS